NPGQPQLTSPPNGAVDLTSPVTLTWTGVTGATEYRVFASFGTSNAVRIGETTAPQLTAQLPAGSISWFVQAVFGDDCPTTVSAKSTFTVKNGDTCSNAGATTPLSPANGATDVGEPVSFSWSAVSGAVAYELYVAANGSSADLAGVTGEAHIERLVPQGSISWYVVSKFAGCPDQKSATFTFTTSSGGN